MHQVLRGALSGTVATLAMSGALLAGERRSPGYRQPPEAVVRRAGALVGHEPRGRAAGLLAALAHLGFGAAVGAVLPLLPRRGPAPLRGTALSLAVYGASYQGWVPVLGALPPASRDRPDRQRVLLASHVVFGAVLGAVEEALRRQGR